MNGGLLFAQFGNGIGEVAQHAIIDAGLLVGLLVSVLAGLVSFASPCVLPLVPGYLAFMTGLSGSTLRSQDRGSGASSRVVAGGILFVLGFTVPFTALGLAVGSVSAVFTSRPWQILLGLLVTALGLSLAQVLPLGFLQRDLRVTGQAIDKGVLGALPLGFVFGIGWTPCIGPAMGAILNLSAIAGGGSSLRGGLLAFTYAMGLGLPFIAFGLLLHRTGGALQFVRARARLLQVSGGLMLTAVGLMIATGAWNSIIDRLRPYIGGFETII